MSELSENIEAVLKIECFICGETETSEWPNELEDDFIKVLKRDGWKADEGGAVCKDCEKNRSKY